jgi:hypothetical protein
MKFRISATREIFYVAEVEADSEKEARDMANGGDVDWNVDHMGGRGLGDDDYKVYHVEYIDEEEDDDDDDDVPPM